MTVDRGPLLSRCRRRVLMADTDSAGVIYYGAVYRWHEAAMMTWLESVGHPIRSVLATGFAFPCVHSEADYTHPLQVDDKLELRMHAGATGTRSFHLVSDAWLGSTRAVTIRGAYVWARLRRPDAAVFGPEPLPDWLRQALEGDHAPG